jgi:MFS family permease
MFALGLMRAVGVSPRRVWGSLRGASAPGASGPVVAPPEMPLVVGAPVVVEVEEAAPAPTGPTTLRTRAFISFVIMFGMGLAAWWPMMTYLSVFVRDVLDEGILAASFLMVAIHGVTATLGLASGPWIRKFGSKWTYVPGLVGLAAFMLVLGLVTDFTFVLVAAPVMGFFLAFHWTGAQAYIIEASPPDRRGLGSGIATSVATLVPAISAPILGLIADRYDFGTMALVAFGIVMTGLVVTVLVVPSLKPAVATADREKVVEAVEAPPPRPTPLLRMPGIISMLIVRAATSMMLGVFVLLSGPKLIDAGGAMSSVGFFVAGASLGGGLAQVAIGWTSDWLGRRALLVTTLVIGVASSVAFGLTDNVVLLLAASGFHGLFRNATQTLMIAVVGDITPPHETGRISSLLTSAFSVGMVVGVLVAGIFFETRQTLPLIGEVANIIPFLIAAAVVILAIVGLFRIPMRGVDVKTTG